ncbi:MAG TPA: LysM peptidoglycan-binding domain-containing protein [Candidatus Paceibacterota bacterium]|nr:LysM peptidoglycan-binding domain-containing protein [Candidatus Paceibacterota bacterium]
MRWRGPFFISLGVNAVIAAAWLIASRHSPSPSQDDSVHAQTVKTNVVVRRQFFSWSEVESTDYPTYIANLRRIECPEQTIRDIIIADVNTLYSRRLATELVTAEQQWWRSEPDSNIVRIASQKARTIDTERRALLANLLGPNWESGDLISLPRPTKPGVMLDGPVLGVLPQDVKKAVEAISVRSQERLQEYLSKKGQIDPVVAAAELAKLRQETRDQLASVLTPSQLEEYLLRYSQNANNLRAEMGTLKNFNATPDEFRSIFRATDSYDQQLLKLAGRSDPNSLLERANLEQARDNAIRAALGTGRYNQYVALHDPMYRDAFDTAQKAGTPEAAQAIYEINRAVAEQRAAIQANTNLTELQKALALKDAELKQLTASAQVTGQDAPDLTDGQPPMPTPVPEGPQPPAITRRTHSYVFLVGDTIASIAQSYGVSMRDLRAANPNVDLRKLKPGDSIRVPDRANQQ